MIDILKFIFESVIAFLSADGTRIDKYILGAIIIGSIIIFGRMFIDWLCKKL